MHPTVRRILILPVLIALAVALAACGPGTTSAPDGAKTLVVATHDSWAMKKSVIAEFEKQTGATVRFQQNGDAGELTNKLVLTKSDPIADVAYGVDNTFASRALDAGVFARFSTAAAPAADTRYQVPGGAGRLAPIDYSDVCVNIDDSWFATKHLTPPKTLADLVEPAYKNLFVTPGATTSSPGLAFLATTIAAEGKNWPAYWKALMNNGAKVTDGWSDAYEVDFTAGGGHGDRPIVLSYSSSPPDTIPKGSTRPTTSALLGTCFRQVEYAGVLAGAKHAKLAQQFVDFMQGKSFQAQLPEQMYVYPVTAGVALPADWARWAPASPHPYRVSATEIATHRTSWLNTWRDIVTG